MMHDASPDPARLQELRHLDDETLVYPGHAFKGAQTTIGQEKRTGLLRDFSKEEWFRMQEAETAGRQ
eukprot:3267243-Prymnesium_polylepis.2